ncbi:flagellar brake protein [Nitrosomonas sp. JL21]|uniref:flagellar brake protein n=1 Tax=Nitrosomonas sp. JL21 TaxID=153949 RepID=UPI001367B1CE|nr:flagellar brake protein [Nitrosomonas sp. JL21]MBL8497617.1 flagellar brake protein [Nitrosomonas sp.]MXS77786.1 flagellar brake protein [Nitrosomonas sp. JL21]
MQEPDPNSNILEVLEPTEFSKDDAEENFRLYSEVDILFILRGIMQAHSLITLYAEPGKNFFLTSILNVDPVNKEMIIDYGSDEKISQQALHSTKLTFVTTQNKIKIEFICNRIKSVEFEGKKAFSVNIPESVLRIQRRDNFRISTPITKPLKCIVPVVIEEKSMQAEITLLDISCGGIGAIDQNPVVHFEPGTVYNNCQISLPDIGTFNTTIKVKNIYAKKLHNGGTYQRIGCEFIGLTAKTEAMIHRYIIKQEQTRKMK